MTLFLRPRFFLPLFLAICIPAVARPEKLRITSTPLGAKVEIDGIAAGTTPFEKDYPSSYFHRPKTALSSRLEHALIARLSFPGYSVKEITLTEGPSEWSSLNGKRHAQYWLFKSDHFEATLDSLAVTFTGSVVARTTAGTAALAPELSLGELAVLAKPAVVELQGARKMGSGFFVTETGVIATNAHVARDETSLLAVLANGQKLEAQVVHIEDQLDIALVKVKGEGFPHLPLAAAETVQQGETVLAVGNPSGAMEFSMTKGIVSAVGKFRDAGPGTWIQTDAPINPGNSGGPLLNLRGEVVGLNTLKLIKKNTTGIGFALSAGDLLDVLNRFYPAKSPLTPDGKQATRSETEGQLKNLGGERSDSSVGTLLFKEPDGASIYIDDHFVGNVPSSFRLAPGLYKIRVTRTGSPEWVQTVEVRASSEATIKPAFAP